jgi:hypothetical protein
MKEDSVPFVGDVDLIIDIISHRDILTNDVKLGELANKSKESSLDESIASYGSRIRKVANIFGIVKKFPNGTWDYTEDGKKIFTCKDKIKSKKMVAECVIKNYTEVKNFIEFIEKNNLKFSEKTFEDYLIHNKKGKIAGTTLRRIKVPLFKIIYWTLTNSEKYKYLIG